jgi:hypothetical protein
MGGVLRARTQMQDRKDLRTGVDGQPQPQDVGVAAQPRPQFVQLDIRKLEMTEKVRVKALSVLPSTGQPGDDGRLPEAKDPFGRRRIQPFGKPQRAPWRSAARGFSNDRRVCHVGP